MKRRAQSGFSLLEMLVVIAIIVVLISVAVFQVVPALNSAHMDSAAALVQDQLRYARAKAIAERGEVIVTFAAPGTVATTAPNITGFLPVTVSLPNDVQFLLLSGMPKTPDSFTPHAAIEFDQSGGAGNPSKIRFEPNGSAVDDSGSFNNGAVYVAQPGSVSSQRAITLLGATARVRTWRVVIKNGTPTSWN